MSSKPLRFHIMAHPEARAYGLDPELVQVYIKAEGHHSSNELFSKDEDSDAYLKDSNMAIAFRTPSLKFTHRECAILSSKGGHRIVHLFLDDESAAGSGALIKHTWHDIPAEGREAYIARLIVSIACEKRGSHRGRSASVEDVEPAQAAGPGTELQAQAGATATSGEDEKLLRAGTLEAEVCDQNVEEDKEKGEKGEEGEPLAKRAKRHASQPSPSSSSSSIPLSTTRTGAKTRAAPTPPSQKPRHKTTRKLKPVPKRRRAAVGPASTTSPTAPSPSATATAATSSVTVSSSSSSSSSAGHARATLKRAKVTSPGQAMPMPGQVRPAATTTKAAATAVAAAGVQGSNTSMPPGAMGSIPKSQMDAAVAAVSDTLFTTLGQQPTIEGKHLAERVCHAMGRLARRDNCTKSSDTSSSASGYGVVLARCFEKSTGPRHRQALVLSLLELLTKAGCAHERRDLMPSCLQRALLGVLLATAGSSGSAAAGLAPESRLQAIVDVCRCFDLAANRNGVLPGSAKKSRGAKKGNQGSKRVDEVRALKSVLQFLMSLDQGYDVGTVATVLEGLLACVRTWGVMGTVPQKSVCIARNEEEEAQLCDSLARGNMLLTMKIGQLVEACKWLSRKKQ